MPRCGVCDMHVPADGAELHLQSRKHNQHLTELRTRIECNTRSLVVNSLPPSISEAALKAAFEEYSGGEVEKVVIDPRQKHFAVIQFVSAASQAAAMAKTHNIKIGTEKLRFQARKPPPAADALKQMEAIGGLLPDAAAVDGGGAAPTAASTTAAAGPSTAAATGGASPMSESHSHTGATHKAPPAFEDETRVKRKHNRIWSWDDVAGIQPAYRTISDATAQAEGLALLQRTESYHGNQDAIVARQQVFAAATEQLGQWLSGVLPGVQLELSMIGSSANGMCHAGSDLDVAVFAHGVAPQEAAEKLIPFLRQHHAVKRVIPLITERIAALSYTDIGHGELHVDVSFDNTSAVRNTAMIREYLRIRPGLRELVMGLTAWITAEVQRWSKYSVFMLALMYLQLQNQVPNLQQLAKTCEQCAQHEARAAEPSSKRMKDDDGASEAQHAAAAASSSMWDYRYCTHVEPAAAMESAQLQAWLGHHFVGCILYYGNDFDASRQAVSPRMGGPLPLRQVHKGMWTKSGVVIEDPFETSHNISSKIGQEAWHNFRFATRAELAHIRHRAGTRRVTDVYTNSIEQLEADGHAAAQKMAAQWRRLDDVTSPGEKVLTARWQFAGRTGAVTHLRLLRRAQERLARATAQGAAPSQSDLDLVQAADNKLVVDVLYPVVGKKLVAELIEGDTTALEAWLVTFVPLVSHRNKETMETDEGHDAAAVAAGTAPADQGEASAMETN